MMSAFTVKQQEVKTVNKDKLKEQLKSIVYDDDIVQELLPVFEKLSNQEGFNQIVDLLESKEQQISVLAGESKWTKESTPSEEEETEVDETTDSMQDDGVDSLIQAKYTKT